MSLSSLHRWPVAALLLGAACGGGGGTTTPDNNPAPEISALSPASVAIGTGPFILTVDGSGFGGFSTVRWNGTTRPTTLVSATRLTATIEAADVAAAGTATVTVVNAGPGGGTSAIRSITITAASVGSVVITPVTGPLVATQSITLQATVKAPDGSTMTGQTVIWTSSDPATATVTASGTVVGVAPGTVTITASSGGVTGTVQVVVVTAPTSGPATWTRVAGHPVEAWGEDLKAWTEALGRTWVVTGSNPVVIRSTADGTNWSTVDPATVGLPARPVCGNLNSCPDERFAIAGTATQVVVTMLFGLPGGASINDAGHFFELWAVRGDGQNWSVQGPTTPGLNQFTPPPGPRNFRFLSLAGGAGWGDRAIIAGGAQWWLPFATGDESFLTFATGPSDAWQMFNAEDKIENDDPNQTIHGVAGSPLGFFAAGTYNADFRFWHSTNGTDWTPRTHPATQVTPYLPIERSTVLYAPSGLVVARRNSQQRIVTWHSADGTTWTETTLPEASSRSIRGLTASGRYILYAETSNRVWTSTNGLVWDAVPNAPSFRRIFAVGSKLFGITPAGLAWELTL